MSEVKTGKQEALELLALDTLIYEQAERLHYLTATAAGMKTFYDPDNLFSVFTASRDWVCTGYYDPDNEAHELPDYCLSVDACLTLKLPDGCIWKLFHGDDKGASAHVLFRPIGKPAGDMTFGQANSLPLAMLTAWWKIQADN